MRWLATPINAMLRAVGSRRRVLLVKYDAAQTNHLNRRHWKNADGASPIASLTPQVRKLLRDRSRMEAHNNSFAKGIVLTLANDLIGTTPRLQFHTNDARANRILERLWSQWSKAIGLAGKLRTMRMARITDGECFAAAITNQALQTPVKLDIRLYESDQIETPTLAFLALNETSGIRYDEAGNPTEYHVLRHHPGDLIANGAGEYDIIPSWRMIHYFRAERPGQTRGVPEMAPALEMFAQLRRYQSATLAAAENVANHTMLAETDTDPDPDADEVVSPEALETIEIERGQMTFMPKGWKLNALKSEQPTTTYPEYERAVKREICRCMNIPLNIALGDSSNFNYASGRLDHQTYHRFMSVERSELERQITDRLLSWWWDELTLISNLWGPGDNQIPLSVRGATPVAHWLYDGFAHVDPSKEASAQKDRLTNGTTTLSRELAKEGIDLEDHMAQLALEAKLRQQYGLPSQFAAVPADPPAVAVNPEDQPEDPPSD